MSAEQVRANTERYVGPAAAWKRLKVAICHMPVCMHMRAPVIKQEMFGVRVVDETLKSPELMLRCVVNVG